MVEAAVTRHRPGRADGFVHATLAPDAVPALVAAEAACRHRVLDLVARRSRPTPVDVSASECDEAVLARRLDEPEAWSDIAVRPELSAVIAMNGDRLAGDEAEAVLVAAERLVAAAVREELVARGWSTAEGAWALSGHLWYPAGTVLGWHTNVRVPGWRAYLSWVAEPGRSFFRYRDPGNGRIVTSWDRGLDLRLFPIEVAQPLWHCVWAGTERHSFGYRLVPPPPG